MKIEWFGQSAFLFVSASGVRVVTDPYDPVIGYQDIDIAADVVTVSHEHRDHNFTGTIKGDPVVLREPGLHEAKGLFFKAIESSHDETGGHERGSNTIFCFSMDGIRICHLGDLGHMLSPEQQKKIGHVDLLLIPVGGRFTIDASGAGEIVSGLNPRIAIPMHFQTAAAGRHLATVDAFISGKDCILRVKAPRFELNQQDLPVKTQIAVMSPTR